MTRFVLTLTAAIIALPLTVRADVTPPMPESYQTATTLAAACAKPLMSPDGQFCLGYLVGVADMLPGPAPGASGRCGPRGIVTSQLVEVFTAWLAHEPAASDRPASAAVAAAFAERFPCKP